jgi:hypothetical protein
VRALGRASLIIGVLSLCGCVATIGCPLPDADSRPVFVLDHGRHTTLVVARADGTLVRYAYGDWRWYAEADTGVWQGLAALAWRTRAAFGRREYAAMAEAPDGDAVERIVRVGVETIHALHAPGPATDALTARLDAQFEAGLERRLVNLAYDLEFVPDPRGYWFWYNSNHRVADWLRALGCTVRGPTLLARWRVEHDS